MFTYDRASLAKKSMNCKFSLKIFSRIGSKTRDNLLETEGGTQNNFAFSFFFRGDTFRETLEGRKMAFAELSFDQLSSRILMQLVVTSRAKYYKKCELRLTIYEWSVD